MIDIIDRAQRAGTIRTLDINKVLLQQTVGRASGGFVSPAVASPASSTASASDVRKDALIERLTSILDRLASDGIPASVALDEIDRKQQLLNQARRFGSK